MILLDAIPSVAEGSEVIAKVKILEVDLQRHAGAGASVYSCGSCLVVQSIRGADEGQIIEIYAEPTSCGGGLDPRSAGRTGFIAGDKTLFSGRW